MNNRPFFFLCLPFRSTTLTFSRRAGCGIAPDFSTPEYAQSKTIQSNKWESCEGEEIVSASTYESNRVTFGSLLSRFFELAGMDPWSFGYNQRTPDDQYRYSYPSTSPTKPVL